MLDLFSIFTKGGMVLWYFQGTAMSLTPAVNALIKSVILQVCVDSTYTSVAIYMRALVCTCLAFRNEEGPMPSTTRH